MRSIQTKISIVITGLAMISTLFLIAIGIFNGRNVLNNYSDDIVLLTVRYGAADIERVMESADNGSPDEAAIKAIVSSISAYGESNTYLTKDGDLYYHSTFKDGALGAPDPEAEKAFCKRALTLDRDKVHRKQTLSDQKLGKVAVEDLGNGMSLIVVVHRGNIAMPQMGWFGRMVITASLLFILLFLAGLLLVRSIIKPLKRMADIADRYTRGDYSERMEVERKDEIGMLSRSLESMSESLRHQIDVADSANKAKSAFLSNMSHEIRTPITAVLGFNEMILRESDDEQILAYAESIENSGHTLLGLINDVLDFSKIEAGKIEIIPADYELSSALNDLVSMIRVRAEEKGLSLQLDFDRNLPRTLNGDEVRIKQIITNILTNAVKYTEKGSVTFRIAYEKPENDPDSVLLKVSVKDTGIGIREDDMRRLFSQFERIDERRNRNIEGTGLGMNISQSLLKMMGSSLQVESEYGKGSEFSFVLKQKVIRWDPIGEFNLLKSSTSGQKERYRSRFRAKAARILIVDDNPTNLLLFKSLIKQTLVKTDVATDGDECLRLCAAEKYDIIFLDHMMPNKDGIETLHELQEMQDSPNQNTPAICLTANAVSGAREEYISQGFKDYLTKPIDSAKLEEMMLKYLPEEKIDRDPLPGGSGTDDAEKTGEQNNPGGLDLLYKQDLIDVMKGILQCGGQDIYLEILRPYYETTDETIDILNGFLAEGDIQNYLIRIHSVKSSSRTVGAESVGEKAARLEQAAKDKDVDYIENNHGDFVAEYRKVRELLQKVFA